MPKEAATLAHGEPSNAASMDDFGAQQTVDDQMVHQNETDDSIDIDELESDTDDGEAEIEAEELDDSVFLVRTN